jgi:DNA repair exonuclease SbcCD ATPase subunit
MKIKEQLLAELKGRYAGRLTTKLIDELADRLSSRVTEESQIQGVIDELEQSPLKITDIQGEGDRRASELQNRIKDLQAELEKAKQPPPPPPPPDENPVLTQLKAMQSRFEALEADAKKEKARSALQEKIKDKQIPSVLLKSVQVNNPDEVDQVVAELEQQAIELRRELGQIEPDPPRRATGPAGTKEQVANDIKTYSTKIR